MAISDKPPVLEAMIAVKRAGEQHRVDMQAQHALERWVALGGTRTTFDKINSAHFSGMTDAAQSLLVRTMEGSNHG